MGLVLVWSHLDAVLLPFLASLTVASLFALPLQRVGERDGVFRWRERCVGCRAEGELLRLGYCPERCAVNATPVIPIVLFVAASTLTIFALADPGDFRGYVLPLGLTGAGIPQLLTAMVIGANAGAAVLLAALFVQGSVRIRRAFERGALLAALTALVGVGLPLGGAASYVAVTGPVALGALLLSAGVAWRSRSGRPAYGLRSVAVAVAPLLLVTLLGGIRLVQIVRLAGAS